VVAGQESSGLGVEGTRNGVEVGSEVANGGGSAAGWLVGKGVEGVGDGLPGVTAEGPLRGGKQAADVCPVGHAKLETVHGGGRGPMGQGVQAGQGRGQDGGWLPWWCDRPGGCDRGHGLNEAFDPHEQGRPVLDAADGGTADLAFGQALVTQVGLRLGQRLVQTIPMAMQFLGHQPTAAVPISGGEVRAGASHGQSGQPPLPAPITVGDEGVHLLTEPNHLPNRPGTTDREPGPDLVSLGRWRLRVW
jgi:hypothetical protein